MERKAWDYGAFDAMASRAETGRGPQPARRESVPDLGRSHRLKTAFGTVDVVY